MRFIGKNPAAATSGRSTRLRTARRSGMTSISPTSRPGSTLVPVNSRSCTRSRWTSSTCILPNGVTSERSLVNFTLQVWRQAGPRDAGRMVQYDSKDISPDMSFLEMLDVLNERLIEGGDVPIAFDHDCREGICGSCSLMINGVAHGPMPGTAACQLHMRSFKDGASITIEPWRGPGPSLPPQLGGERRAPRHLNPAGG